MIRQKDYAQHVENSLRQNVILEHDSNTKLLLKVVSGKI